MSEGGPNITPEDNKIDQMSEDELNVTPGDDKIDQISEDGLNITTGYNKIDQMSELPKYNFRIPSNTPSTGLLPLVIYPTLNGRYAHLF